MIKTNHGKAYVAFIALSQLRNMVRGQDALRVFHLKGKLKESAEFMGEEEMRLVQECGGTVAENGLLVIPDGEKRSTYIAERKKLDALECEIDAEPVEIPIDRCPDVTAEQMEMLDGFVQFVEVDNSGNE